MKKFLINIILLASASSALANSLSPTSEDTPTDSLSYAVGIFMGENLKQMIEMSRKNFNRMGNTNFDEALALQTALDMVNGKQMSMTSQEAMNMLNSAVDRAHHELEAANKAKGEAFLAENGKKKGVVTTASGLQYKVITKGNGVIPTKDDKVKVHYEGKTIDGKVFDSSYKRNEPTTFGVTQVIKGWTEALCLMPAGSKWEVYIPSELAYGERGAGEDIQANETLIFTIELIDVEKKEVKTDAKTAPTTVVKTDAKKEVKTDTKKVVKKPVKK